MEALEAAWPFLWRLEREEVVPALVGGENVGCWTPNSRMGDDLWESLVYRVVD